MLRNKTPTHFLPPPNKEPGSVRDHVLQSRLSADKQKNIFEKQSYKCDHPLVLARGSVGKGNLLMAAWVVNLGPMILNYKSRHCLGTH